MLTRLAGRIARLRGWRSRLVAFLAGAILALAQPPYDFLLIGFVAFPLLVWLLDGAEAEGGFLPRLLPSAMIGWWFGFGYFVSGLWWIGQALLVDAEEFAWALPLAVLGLPAFLAFFYAFATAIARLLWSEGLGRIFALAFGFALAEWLRSFLFTGFPWNALGYALAPTPMLMQSIAVIGFVGLTGLGVLIFSAPALLTGGRGSRAGLALASVLLLAHIGYGKWVLSHAPAINAASDGPVIRIVQPSIEQSLKWDNQARRAIFDRLITLTETPPAPGMPRPDIVVWPETSVPYILTSTPEALERIGAALQPGQVLLAGAVREERRAGDDQPRYFNSITVIDDAGRIVDSADKLHLVPFGEYLPFERLLRAIGLQEVVEMPGGFTAAAARRSMTVGNNITVLPLICYEVIFPDELGYSGAPVQSIVNITNDAWYGDTLGPYQHFRQAQLRAVEQGLPVIRVANNGLSAVIDPFGRISAGLLLNDVAVKDTFLPRQVAPFWGSAPNDNQVVITLCLLLVISVAFRKVFGGPVR